jgi:hypothetical protein
VLMGCISFALSMESCSFLRMEDGLEGSSGWQGCMCSSGCEFFWVSSKGESVSVLHRISQ